MNTKEISILAQELHLFGISESLERRLLQASADGQTGAEILINLFEDEKIFRKNRHSKVLQTKAKFRRNSFIEDWDFSFERGITKTKIRELAQLGFCHDKKNLILLGPTGCGKTQLAISLGRIACQNQLSVFFTCVNKLFEDAQAQRSSGKYLIWSKKIKAHDIIIFDDFGMRSYTHDEAILLMDFLEERYQQKAHIFTSQVDIDGWKSLFEDPVIGEALLDRIKHPCEKIKLIGGSYREVISQNQSKPS